MNISTKPYNDFTSYLSLHFPHKVQKISIDAGFNCPNRDGTKGRGGCTYCNNRSFSPEYDECSKTVTEQLKKGISFFSHKYTEMKYLAYFQSYTNTYNDVDLLISLYEEALAYPDVVGLVVSTRPDCMPDELLKYFEKKRANYFIIIEYGIESTLNKTLERVNRQHTFEESCETILKTAQIGIPVGGHMILGLPGESFKEILSHASTLSTLPLTTLKLHQLQIIKGTAMAREYKLLPDSFHMFELDEYIELCVDFSERLNPDFFIERFASQSPKDLLLAPNWGIKNNELTQKIIKRFKERKTFQGRLFS
ncbi:MAG TPA: TIGR01212 family radical SAM protein [Dysgonamonadaceae bacterium]|jgi:radical SAM protein (TIGR01212 family)|nr:TIGR01212 family radical SAM protein [Dysgonamonadaceae bacterium]